MSSLQYTVAAMWSTNIPTFEAPLYLRPANHVSCLLEAEGLPLICTYFASDTVTPFAKFEHHRTHLIRNKYGAYKPSCRSSRTYLYILNKLFRTFRCMFIRKCQISIPSDDTGQIPTMRFISLSNKSLHYGLLAHNFYQGWKLTSWKPTLPAFATRMCNCKLTR